MKARLTALLTLLLTVSAVFGVPVTSGVQLRVTNVIVCEARERRAAEAPAEIRPPRPAGLATSAPPSFYAAAPTTLFLAHALFQRPPPAA